MYPFGKHQKARHAFILSTRYSHQKIGIREWDPSFRDISCPEEMENKHSRNGSFSCQKVVLGVKICRISSFVSVQCIFVVQFTPQPFEEFSVPLTINMSPTLLVTCNFTLLNRLFSYKTQSSLTRVLASIVSRSHASIVQVC